MKNLRILAAVLTAVISCILFQAASGAPAPASSSPAAPPTAKSAEAKASTSGNQAGTVASSYVLRATDVINVDVIDDQRATHDYKIALDGTVQLTYLEGPIKLSGLTVQEAIDAIKKAYVAQKIFVKPQITISVKEYASSRIYVIGAVGKPGWVIIPPEEKLSVVSALAQAGGPTRNASRYITITHKKPDGKSETIKFDARAAWDDAEKDMPVQEGDSIHVGESYLGDSWF